MKAEIQIAENQAELGSIKGIKESGERKGTLTFLSRNRTCSGTMLRSNNKMKTKDILGMTWKLLQCFASVVTKKKNRGITERKENNPITFYLTKNLEEH